METFLHATSYTVHISVLNHTGTWMSVVSKASPLHMHLSHERCQLIFCRLHDLWGTHLCNLCLDTRWLAHVLRDRPDDFHGEGGLLQLGGPVADALWLQGFGVALLTLCLFVGKKQ